MDLSTTDHVLSIACSIIGIITGLVAIWMSRKTIAALARHELDVIEKKKDPTAVTNQLNQGS